LTYSSRKHFKTASIATLVICIAGIALFSRGRPESSPALHQRPDSIAVRFRGLGTDRYLWLSPSGESTSAIFRNGQFQELKTGRLSESQWTALCQALPTDFFAETESFFEKNLTPQIAYEEYATGLSVRLPNERRTVWIHPSHLYHGSLKTLKEQLSQLSESMSTRPDAKAAYLLGIEDESYQTEQPPSSLSSLLRRAADTPCKWYLADQLPPSGRYALQGCSYLLVTGEVWKSERTLESQFPSDRGRS